MADYQIKFGDTLTSIASRFGTTSKQLVTNNEIASANDISTGDTITVPDVSQPVIPRPKARTNSNPAGTCATCPKQRRIVIDPGHGGKTIFGDSSGNNATSISGVLEKNLALKYSRILRDKLLSVKYQPLLTGSNIQLEVLLTRDSDINLKLADRNAVADNGADIFLSIHFNGFSEMANGIEIYTRDSGNFNSSDDQEFAKSLLEEVFNEMKEINSEAINRGAKKANHGVTVDPKGNGWSGKKCVTALIEIEFITNHVAEYYFVSGLFPEKNGEIYQHSPLSSTNLEAYRSSLIDEKALYYLDVAGKRSLIEPIFREEPSMSYLLQSISSKVMPRGTRSDFEAIENLLTLVDKGIGDISALSAHDEEKLRQKVAKFGSDFANQNINKLMDAAAKSMLDYIVQHRASP